MKLIVISPFVYYPGVPHGGGAVCWGQLIELARDNEVHFLSFATPGSKELSVAQPHLMTFCKTVTTIEQRLGRLQVIRCKLGIFTKLEPKVASLCWSEEMQQALQSLIEQTKPDAVLIQFPQMAQYVAACHGVATVMDVQDSFSVSSYRNYKAADRALNKFSALLTWLAWVKYESRWYPRFSVVAALTQQDAAGLEIFTPGMGASVSTAAVSIPANKWMPTNRQTIAFIGSYAHLPNADAVIFFVQEVLPLILAELPDTVFLVAGKGATPKMESLVSKNVQMAGMVADSNEFLASAAVVVIPLRSGGGVKIKTLEAMAGGCPIVSSSIGAEETGAVSGTHLLVADSSADFARSVITLLKDKEAAHLLGRNARALAQDKFSWAAKRLSLTKLIQLAVARNSERLKRTHGTS